MVLGGIQRGALLIAAGFVVFTIVGIFVEGPLGLLLSLGGGVLMIVGASMIRKSAAQGTPARTMATIALGLTWITFIMARLLTTMSSKLDDASLDTIRTFVILSGVNDVVVTLVGFLALVALCGTLERVLLVGGLLVTIGGALYSVSAIDQIAEGTLTYESYATTANWLIAGSNVPVAVAAALVGLHPRQRPAGKAIVLAPHRFCANCGAPLDAAADACPRCGRPKTVSPPSW